MSLSHEKRWEGLGRMMPIIAKPSIPCTIHIGRAEPIPICWMFRRVGVGGDILSPTSLWWHTIEKRVGSVAYLGACPHTSVDRIVLFVRAGPRSCRWRGDICTNAPPDRTQVVVTDSAAVPSKPTHRLGLATSCNPLVGMDVCVPGPS